MFNASFAKPEYTGYAESGRLVYINTRLSVIFLNCRLKIELEGTFCIGNHLPLIIIYTYTIILYIFLCIHIRRVTFEHNIQGIKGVL